MRGSARLTGNEARPATAGFARAAAARIRKRVIAMVIEGFRRTGRIFFDFSTNARESANCDA